MHSLVFNERSVWEQMLPPELQGFLPDSSVSRSKWLSIPIRLWPGVLVLARDDYWKGISEGRDMRDISNWDEKILSGLLDYLPLDPGSVVLILHVELTMQEQLQGFFSNIVDASNKILQLSNQQDGEISTQLISTKQRLVAQIKNLVDALIKWENGGIMPKVNKQKKLPYPDINGTHLPADMGFYDPLANKEEIIITPGHPNFEENKT